MFMKMQNIFHAKHVTKVTQSHNLKKHIKSPHEGVKKLSFKLCDKSYAHDHNLKNHIKTFHHCTKISCDSCDKSFAQSHTLKKHIKIVMKVDLSHSF